MRFLGEFIIHRMEPQDPSREKTIASELSNKIADLRALDEGQAAGRDPSLGAPTNWRPDFVKKTPRSRRTRLEWVFVVVLLLVFANITFGGAAFGDYHVVFGINFLLLGVYGGVAASHSYFSLSPLYAIEGAAGRILGIIVMSVSVVALLSVIFQKLSFG